MLTDDDVIADLSRLRERSAGIQYRGEVPLTRRSLAVTAVPVAAVAVAAVSLGTAAVVGGAGGNGSAAPTSPPFADASQSVAPSTAIHLVSAEVTLGARTITYRHAPGKDPFGHGWQAAYVYGTTLPAGATRFSLGGGELVWVADAPGTGSGSVMIVTAGPSKSYVGVVSGFSRADLEDFVRTNLHGR